MAKAKKLVDSFNAIAADWARAQAAVEATLRGAREGVISLRTWPTPEEPARRIDAGDESRLEADGWVASTIDLREGLSVVEVFTPSPEAEADAAPAAARPPRP